MLEYLLYIIILVTYLLLLVYMNMIHKWHGPLIEHIFFLNGEQVFFFVGFEVSDPANIVF